MNLFTTNIDLSKYIFNWQIIKIVSLIDKSMWTNHQTHEIIGSKVWYKCCHYTAVALPWHCRRTAAVLPRDYRRILPPYYRRTAAVLPPYCRRNSSVWPHTANLYKVLIEWIRNENKLSNCSKLTNSSKFWVRDSNNFWNSDFGVKHITTIVNFANCTKRLSVPEELDQTVDYSLCATVDYSSCAASSHFTVQSPANTIKRTTLIHVNFITIPHHSLWFPRQPFPTPSWPSLPLKNKQKTVL